MYARGAQAIRMHQMRMYACALKIASEQRATDFKPGISWSVAQWYSEKHPGPMDWSGAVSPAQLEY